MKVRMCRGHHRTRGKKCGWTRDPSRIVVLNLDRTMQSPRQLPGLSEMMGTLVWQKAASIPRDSNHNGNWGFREMVEN
jgi:hypothetical protein